MIKMSRLIIFIAHIIIIIFSQSPAVAAEKDSDSLDQSNKDTLDAKQIYYRAYKTALKDKKIDSSEEAILRSLRISMGLSNQEVQNLIAPLNKQSENMIDQTGRWQFVLQNTGWGAGLYGWAIPYVLGNNETKWTIGMEMLSLGTTFYFSHRYSDKIHMPLARSNMLGLGSLMGLNYGFAINNILDLDNEDDQIDDDDDEKRTWAATLMGSVPLGMLVGNYLNKKWQPNYGRTWTLSLGALVTLKSLYDLQMAFDPEPEEPYFFPEYSTNENEYNNWIKKRDRWEKRRGLLTLAAYPVGIYSSKLLTENKHYTLGDALMLSQGYLLGMVYNLIIMDMMNVEKEKYYRLGNIPSGLIGTYIYQRIIDEYDFGFGESVLMGLGTTSGMAFGLGLAIITELEGEVTDLLVMSGGLAGSLITRPMLSPNKEGNEYSDNSSRISLTPALFIEQGSDNRKDKKLIPGVSISYQF